MSTVKTLPFDGAFSILRKVELTMNKFDMNQMRKQVEAMHRLKAEAQAVEHIGESFDALEAEIGEVAELLEELGDALITVSEMLTGILSEGTGDEEPEENDEDDCDCCQCPFQALMDAADGEIHFIGMM